MVHKWDATRLATIRQLMASEVLGRAVLLGGEGGLDRTVKDVHVTTSDGRGMTLPTSVLLVIDGSVLRTDSYQVDLTLRAVNDAGGAGLLLTSPRTAVGLAAPRLANKLNLPLILIDDDDPLAVGDRLRQLVSSPQILATHLLLEAMESLRRSSHKGGAVGALGTLAGELELPTSLVGVEGTALVGPELVPPLATDDRLPVPMTTIRGNICQVTHPIQLAPGERPSFWLVSRREDASEVWPTVAADILQLAGWAIGTRLVGERLQRERDARFRLGVLNEIIAAGDNPEPALIQQIGVLGWAVDGWCAGLHIQVSGAIDQQRLLAVTEDLGRNLGSAGINAPLIERPDGWTLWTESATEPTPGSYQVLSKSMRLATRRFVNSHPGISLHVGIGLPQYGLKGLRASLSEAREASLIAQAGGGDAVVQHIDELGIKRILFGWYASERFSLFAKTLLDPLLAADADGELVTTLECFLDNQSSPTLTATTLNLHRNTILNRMERIRSLLSVDLEHPDERLAVQLACRVLRLNPGNEPHSPNDK